MASVTAYLHGNVIYWEMHTPLAKAASYVNKTYADYSYFKKTRKKTLERDMAMATIMATYSIGNAYTLRQSSFIRK